VREVQDVLSEAISDSLPLFGNAHTRKIFCLSFCFCFLHQKNLLCFSFVDTSKLKPLGCENELTKKNEHICKLQNILTKSRCKQFQGMEIKKKYMHERYRIKNQNNRTLQECRSRKKMFSLHDATAESDITFTMLYNNLDTVHVVKTTKYLHLCHSLLYAQWHQV
jgi:hypothetical protein